MDMFQNKIAVVNVQLYTITENYWPVFLQWIDFLVCKLYLDKAINIGIKI